MTDAPNNSEQANANILTLPRQLTIETAKAFAAEAHEKLDSMHSAKIYRLTLDAAATEVITTPGVQLVIALSRALEALNGSLQISRLRPSFKETFSELGLAGRLIEWEAKE